MAQREVAIHLSRNIQQLRRSRNLTQSQLAKLAESPAPSGEPGIGRGQSTLTLLVRLAGALQCSWNL